MVSLPVPTSEEVAEFKRLYVEKYGVELSDEEALDQCIRLVRYVFLTQCALPYLRSEQK